MPHLEELKKIMIVKVRSPQKKKYRKIDEQDKVLLDYLGIPL
jgi:hypothetical protein